MQAVAEELQKALEPVWMAVEPFKESIWGRWNEEDTSKLCAYLTKPQMLAIEAAMHAARNALPTAAESEV
jgi:hypothetical protein